MKLEDLGYDSWFRQKNEELGASELSVARVTRVDRERYLVSDERGETQGEATGNLLFSATSGADLPCVGDWVLVQWYNDHSLAIIHNVLPRKSFLRRKVPGNTIDYQMIGANIDVAFIVQSCDDNFNLRRLERYLVTAAEGHIAPTILLSKVDLISPEMVEQRVSSIRQANMTCSVVPFSNSSGQGFQDVEHELQKGSTYCLLGSSGVGKTTLLNRLLGSEEFETAPVREKDSRGRHTTSRRQLTILENGAMIIDTPGMRELGVMGVDAGLTESFSDIGALAGECRYNDCTHTRETGCAVLKAVSEGSLDRARYESYLKLRKESEFYAMSYLQRRAKDKQFGKMVKSALKEVRKRKPLN